MSSSVILRTIVPLLLLTCIGMGFAQDKNESTWTGLPDFSATEVRGALSWKIHHSGSKLRVDASPAAATIWAPEEDKVYNLLLLPTKSTCVVMKTSEAKVMRSPFQVAYGPNSARTASTEKKTLDGHVCTMLDGVTTVPGGKVNSKIWAADDLKGIPLRIDLLSDTASTVTAVYRDVVIGAPDASLFALPGKCIPPQKTYQLAPGSKPIQDQSPTDQKAPDHKR